MHFSEYEMFEPRVNRKDIADAERARYKRLCDEIDIVYKREMQTENRPKAIIKSSIEKMELAIDRYNDCVNSNFANRPDIKEKITIDRTKGSFLRDTINHIWYYTVEGTYVYTRDIKKCINYLSSIQETFIGLEGITSRELGLVKIIQAIRGMFFKVVNTYTDQSKKANKSRK